MGFRRSAVVLATAAAALFTAPAAGAAPPPLNVEMGQVRCHDLSWLVPTFPFLGEQFGKELDRVANVPVTIRGAEGSTSVPFTVTADGQRKAQGFVGPGGTVVTGISVPRDDVVRIVVRSDDTVLMDRTLFVSCEGDQKPQTKPVHDARPAPDPEPAPDNQLWWPFGPDQPSPFDWLPDFLR